DDRTQTQRIAAAGFFDQQTRHQAADAAEAEQHDILRLADGFGVDADQVGNLLTHEIVNGYARFFCVFIEYGDAAGVDVRGAQIQRGERLDDREGFEFGEFVLLDLTHGAVRLHDVERRLVNQVLAVDIRFDVVFPIQLADQRDHALGQGFTLFPI